MASKNTICLWYDGTAMDAGDLRVGVQFRKLFWENATRCFKQAGGRRHQ
jgi:hypothetical protein